MYNDVMVNAKSGGGQPINFDQFKDEKKGTLSVLGVYIHEQLYGLPIHNISDVLPAHKITSVPLSDRSVLGVMNLRGRVVTVLDLISHVNQDQMDHNRKLSPKPMNVVIEHKAELYSILVDYVSDVLHVSSTDVENLTLNGQFNERWQKIAFGMIKVQDEIMVLIDSTALFDFE